jgi:hypothetical protein
MKFLLAVFLCGMFPPLFANDFPPPLAFGPTNSYGRELQRSMRLMADSSASKKRTVKVLFYGQSVTEEIWSAWVGDFLRARYPNANLIVTNLAIGYTSELLVKLADLDIVPFYPDLMIFQEYGPIEELEQIVELTRRRTTADILIQTEHINYATDVDEPIDPNGELPARALRNYAELPAIASKYGAELADIRTYWKAYLRQYSLQTEQLLRDHIHPNTQGSFLMSELVKSYLRVDRSFSSERWNAAERTFRVGAEINWTNDTLNLEFTGNRVDVLVDGSGNTPVKVRIDGRRPSEFPELYHFTRTDYYPNTYWVDVLRFNPQKPLIVESWAARILTFSVTNGIPFATFDVTGSVTGPDGAGSITQPFISHSGRVTIDPADWLMLYWAAAYYPTVPRLEPGYQIRWHTIFEGKDEFVPQVDKDPTVETTITLAQGLANGRHILTLERAGPAEISAIRIFNPLARVQPPRPSHVELAGAKMSEDKVTVQAPLPGRYLLEGSSDFKKWEPVTAPTSQSQISVDFAPGQRFFRARVID